jgi:hypothetical protein
MSARLTCYNDCEIAEREAVLRDRLEALILDVLPTAIEAESAGAIGAVARVERRIDELIVALGNLGRE